MDFAILRHYGHNHKGVSGWSEVKNVRQEPGPSLLDCREPLRGSPPKRGPPSPKSLGTRLLPDRGKKQPRCRGCFTVRADRAQRMISICPMEGWGTRALEMALTPSPT